METSKEEIVIKRADDHWAFLEHIEAPMWADLTLEAKSGVEDINDDWFSVSHLFHQWSSHELKSKFSKSGEEIVTSAFDSQGPPSPELPSSVSRSRGKHFKSKKWGVNLDVSFDKKLPARMCFPEVSGFGPEVKPKLNATKSKGTSSAKSMANGYALSNCTKSMAGRSLAIRSGSMNNKAGESNSRSTITSEYTQGQENLTEVSSKPYDKKSQLSFRSTTSLRKSCVVKKTLRVDINGDSKKSRARKSSSGKSSVGSCSNPVSDGKDVAIVNPAAKNRCKLSNASRKSTVHIEAPKLLSRLGTTAEFAKPTYHKATKSVAPHQILPSRACLPANKQNSSTSATKEQLEHGKPNGLAGKRNENIASFVAVHQKSSKSDVLTGGFNDQRITERNILRKSNSAGSTVLKGQRKAPRDATNTNNLTRRIYFR
ncbi:uncharacterized protein LOC114762295 isoform X2 [Neltuma alba]|uniref:uncharacterized protein LOC114762295 isoform X2 n=1 Tax=Neltuma alba TaxID=207710 RepID=UPI0010A4FB65|nr:uncharacterized protein LOC114762295 isoform X2 [Prosopis alba]